MDDSDMTDPKNEGLVPENPIDFTDEDRKLRNEYMAAWRRGEPRTPEQKAAASKYAKFIKHTPKGQIAYQKRLEKQATEEFKAKRRERYKKEKERNPLKFYEASKRYRESEKGKAARDRYRNTPREREMARQRSAKFRKTEKGKASRMAHSDRGDLELCLLEANRNSNGDPLCMYSNRVVNTEINSGYGRAVAEHIDNDIKGTKDDGPSNWVLSEWCINGTKKAAHGNPFCFYEWHEKNRDILRPLQDILRDLNRLRKRIPPMRSIKNE